MRYKITKWLFGISFTVLLGHIAFAQETTLHSVDLYDGNESFSYETTLSVFTFKNSNWNETNVVEEVKKAAQIWTQCGLKINEVKINFIDVAPKYLVLSGNEDIKLTQIYLRNETQRPVVFLVHEIAGEASIGYSYREIRDFDNNIVRGTIWLPDNILSETYRALRSPEYSTLAHEMAHVLLNLGHTSIRNILGDSPAVVNATISETQCKRLRMSSYVKKI